jgi:hypothetical protein
MEDTFIINLLPIINKLERKRNSDLNPTYLDHKERGLLLWTFTNTGYLKRLLAFCY